MGKMRNLFQYICVVLFIVSCGGTQLTNLWKDPSYNGPPLKKLMVIAFRRDPVNRRMWEDAVVNAIGQQKSTASVVPSYQLFPNDVPPPDSVKEMVATR
jgi:hypothetical protein